MASGKLEVEVVARTEELEKGLARAESELQKTSQRLEFLGGITATVEDRMSKLGVALSDVGAKASEVSSAFSPLFEKAGAQGEQLLMTFEQLEQGFEDFIVSLQNMPEIDFASQAQESVYGISQTLPAQGKSVGNKFGKSMLRGMAAGIGVTAIAALMIRSIDDAMGKTLEHVRSSKKKTWSDLGVTIGESLASGVASIPIFGKIFEVGGEIGDALWHEDSGGGSMSMERDQQESRKGAPERAAHKARIAARNARAAEAMEQKKQREKTAKEQVDLAKLTSKHQLAELSAAKAMDTSSIGEGGLSQSQREQAIFKEAELRKKLTREQLEFEIEQRLKAIPETSEAERRLMEEQMRVEASIDFVNIEESLARRLTALDKEYDRRDKLEKELEEKKVAAAKLRAEKELEEMTRVLQEQSKMQEELVDARASAQMQVAGATATFSTAGGSFTSAVSAQVNEAKILNTISKKSQALLESIVLNTARMGISLS
tara:strand:- start:962 stop:2425 length:1464 start_codon:yes stop_codon:yes gene_type:complete